MKKLGFTLAEVLISLVIIGVVAAITLPALQTNVNKTAIEKQTLKFYQQFKEAIDLYMVDEETDSIASTGLDPDEFVKEHFAYRQICSTTSGCYADTYAAIGGSESYYTTANTDLGSQSTDGTYTTTTGSYMLTDGTVFYIKYYTDSRDECMEVTFDVNGTKGPNQNGYDFSKFYVFYDGSIDESGITPDVRTDSSNTESIVSSQLATCLANSSGGGCFGHFIRSGFRFDYVN